MWLHPVAETTWHPLCCHQTMNSINFVSNDLFGLVNSHLCRKIIPQCEICRMEVSCRHVMLWFVLVIQHVSSIYGISVLHLPICFRVPSLTLTQSSDWPRGQGSNPECYGKIDPYQITTKHSKAFIVTIFVWINLFDGEPFSRMPYFHS